MRARAAAYPLWKRGNEMDQTIAFLGGDARMRLLAQMMAAEGYDVCSWELTGAPKPLALCDALKADIIVLPLPAEKNGYLSGTELTMESLLRSLRREHRIFAGVGRKRQRRIPPGGSSREKASERQHSSVGKNADGPIRRLKGKNAGDAGFGDHGAAGKRVGLQLLLCLRDSGKIRFERIMILSDLNNQ